MKVADIKRAACVGGGVIGSSWAIQFAMRGLAVTLYDINDEQLKRSEAQMHKSLDALEQFNAITPRDFPSSGGMNPPCGNRLRRFCGAKAPSPRGGAPLKSDGGARRGGVSHACD